MLLSMKQFVKRFTIGALVFQSVLGSSGMFDRDDLRDMSYSQVQSQARRLNILRKFGTKNQFIEDILAVQKSNEDPDPPVPMNVSTDTSPTTNSSSGSLNRLTLSLSGLGIDQERASDHLRGRKRSAEVMLDRLDERQEPPKRHQEDVSAAPAGGFGGILTMFSNAVFGGASTSAASSIKPAKKPRTRRRAPDSHRGQVTLATTHGYRITMHLNRNNARKAKAKNIPEGSLGCGEAGVVWDARDPNGHQCVIKVSRNSKKMAGKDYADIVTEARWTQRLGELQVANIAAYREHFDDPKNGIVELVLQKVPDNQELMDITRLNGDVNPIPQCRQVAGVLACIHVNRICHRDLHTGNVMIQQTMVRGGGRGRSTLANAFVIDWSRATSYNRQLTRNNWKAVEKLRGADGTNFRAVVTHLLHACAQPGFEDTVRFEHTGTKFDGMFIKDFCLTNPRGMDAFQLVFLLSDVRCFMPVPTADGEDWIPARVPNRGDAVEYADGGYFDQLPFVREATVNGERRLIITQ